MDLRIFPGSERDLSYNDSGKRYTESYETSCSESTQNAESIEHSSQEMNKGVLSAGVMLSRKGLWDPLGYSNIDIEAASNMGASQATPAVNHDYLGGVDVDTYVINQEDNRGGAGEDGPGRGVALAKRAGTKIKRGGDLKDGDKLKLGATWKHFCTETSIHGVGVAASEQAGLPKRIIFGLVVLSSFLGLFTSTVTLMSQALEYNTVTRTDIRLEQSMTFPSITVCNICPYKFTGDDSDDPMFRFLAKTSFLGPFLPELNFYDPAVMEFVMRNTTDVFEEYALGVSIARAEFDGERLDLAELQVTDTPLGRCYVFNGPSSAPNPRVTTNNGRNNGLKLLMNIQQYYYGIANEGSAGIQMFVSEPMQSARLEEDGFTIGPGLSANVAISPVKYTFLPPPYKSYGNTGCVDIEGEASTSPDLLEKMVSAPAYSFQLCMDQCILKMASIECGCYSYLLVLPDLPPCKMYETVYGCLPYTIDKFKKESADDDCDCPRPCSLIRYDTITSTSQLPSRAASDLLTQIMNFSDITEARFTFFRAIRPPPNPRRYNFRENLLEVNVYFDSMLIRHESHVPEITVQSFISSLGGQMGICLGASLVSVVELGEAIMATVYLVFRKIRRCRLIGRGKRRVEHEMTEVPKRSDVLKDSD